MTLKTAKSDPFVHVQLRTLQILSVSVGIAASGLIGLHLRYNGDEVLAPTIAVILLIPCVLSPFVYKRFGSINIAGACFCVPLTIAIWVSTYLVGGISAQIAPVLVVVPIFAAYFLEQRFAIVICSLNVFVILAMYGLDLTNNVDKGAVLTGTAALHATGNILAILGFIAGIISLTFMKFYRQVLDDLTEAKIKSEEASRAKSNFLANMSHEIRTPMNGIMGMLDLLVQSGLAEKQGTFAQTARASADDLMRILNDILDISKLDAGQVQIEMVAMSPHQIITDIASLYASNAEEKGLELRFSVSDDVPDWIEGDPTRVRQVLANLVSNAIKFTEQGAVDILAWTEGGEQSLSLVIEVIDTGIGIPGASHTTLFDRFTQADNTTTRKYGGTGLGLAICKQLIEQMQGQIDLESTEGLGTRVRFSLPTERRAHPKLTQKHDEQTVFDLNGRHVLVVEDNAINQRTIRTFLETAGMTVTIAANGQFALEHLSSHSFDVILMDIQMPIMDGPTTTKHIRTLEEDVRHIPIVALTANAMSGDREKYLACGMNDYVSKPIDFHQLIRVIGRLTDAPQINSPPPTQTTTAQNSSTELKPAADRALQELLDEIA